MGSDDLFKKKRIGRIKREKEKIEQKATTWLIVCEGIKTETNYIAGLIKYLEEKYNKKVIPDIIGTRKKY